MTAALPLLPWQLICYYICKFKKFFWFIYKAPLNLLTFSIFYWNKRKRCFVIRTEFTLKRCHLANGDKKKKEARLLIDEEFFAFSDTQALCYLYLCLKSLDFSLFFLEEKSRDFTYVLWAMKIPTVIIVANCMWWASMWKRWDGGSALPHNLKKPQLMTPFLW